MDILHTSKGGLQAIGAVEQLDGPLNGLGKLSGLVTTANEGTGSCEGHGICCSTSFCSLQSHILDASL